MQFKRIEIILNILFWILATWFVVSQARSIESVEIIDGVKSVVYVRNYERTVVYFLAQLFFFVFFYSQLYLIHRLRSPKALKGFVLKSIALLFCTPIFYVLFAQVVLFPNNENVKDLGRLSSAIIFYMMLAIFYGFSKKWIQQERIQNQLELTKRQAELNLIKQQLQPHFLFNTMNNLLAMVDQEKNPRLASSIDKLSNLLRYVVYDTADEKVPIMEEVSFIKNFAELHLLRFEDDEIDFKIEIVGSFNAQEIEPGIFLCYVENAFKHGVQPEEHGFIHVRVNISQSNTIVFHIENSLPNSVVGKEKGGFGIQANQERLDLVYPNKHSLVFKKEPNFSVTLTLNTND